jgi:hypothetical protein
LDGGSNFPGYHRDIILQAGVTSKVDGGGATQYRPFYGWSPGNVQFPNLQIRPGDSVDVKITVQNNGSASIDFAVNGQRNTFAVARPSGRVFRGETAEWIVERNEPDDSDVGGPKPLAAFTSNDFPAGMRFQKALGTLSHGSQDTDVWPTTAEDLLWMEATPHQNGEIPIAKAALPSMPSTIEITHV